MNSPLVSVICISHNHGLFIEEAISSVISQTYDQIEIILVDDSSDDNTPEVICQLKRKFPHIQTILLNDYAGNCKAFNSGLALARGDYIIDLSADDLLLPDRIKDGLKCFHQRGNEYGVNFTDAAFIDETGNVTGYHYKRNTSGQLINEVPEGIIYEKLLARYFICTPTMMIRRSVLDQLNGYDENLYYEDFDFWVRSGKITRYCYTDKVLVKKRALPGSLSTKQYKRDSKMLHSTYLVCQKAERLNESDAERQALLQRAQFEFRKALFSGNYRNAYDFSSLMLRNLKPGIRRSLVSVIHTILSTAGEYMEDD